jgi:hypothetical protein
VIVTIHQPHYLPWLGYLHRMARADLFVMLDHVQFERANYQNRTQVRINGEPRWLTVPVVQRSQKERILDKTLDPVEDLAKKHLLTLKHAYRDAGFFSHYARELQRLYAAKWERLVDLNAAALELLRGAFGITTQLVNSSTLGVEGAKGELILEICQAVGADTLLVGLGGSRGYLDRDAFERAGIRLEFQQFTHPRYPQCGTQPFSAGLSSVDMLFNCGPRSRDLLLGSQTAVESRIAA